MLAVAPRLAWAHDQSLSTLNVTATPDGVDAQLVLPVRGLVGWFPPQAGEDQARHAAWLVKRLETEGPRLLEVRINYSVVSPTGVRTRLVEEDGIEVGMTFPKPPGSDAVHVIQVYSKHIDKLPADHRQVLTVYDRRGGGPGDSGGVDKPVAEHALTAGQFSAFVQLPPPQAAAARPGATAAPGGGAAGPHGAETSAPPAPSFVVLGVEHILTGYDHLLFLAALLLVCSTFTEAATIITSFTVAHSITLAMAALGVVDLSPDIVEPLIAASIIYVAVENLVRGAPDPNDPEGGRRARHRLHWRWVITFAFGLVHGLGFASMLREAGLGASPGGVALPLLKFNLGVEAGQLAVAALFFPLILALSRRPAVARWMVPACSVLIAAAGARWLFERVVLS